MRFFPKELSWLAFNERVLQEAADKTVPVIERMRFLGIFSSNMDEFFRVRVADVRRRIFYAQTTAEHAEAEQLMAAIQQKVLSQQEQFDNTYREVLRALLRKNIRVIDELQTTDEERAWLTKFFHEKIKRYIVPLQITATTDLIKAVNEDATYLCVEIVHNGEISYSALEVPRDELSRFIKLPFKNTKRNKRVILLDNVICLCLNELYEGIVPFDSLRAFSFKLTRDADYSLLHDIDQSVLEQMEEGIRQRFEAEPVRLVYDSSMPRAMLYFLHDKFELTSHDSLVAGGRYRNTRDFVKFENWGHKSLVNPALTPLEHPYLVNHRNVFDALTKADILLNYPYHKFAHVTELVRQAAYDPLVQSIQICIYRVAPHSRIVHSLIEAVNNGKKVTVMVELQARFDEEANIEWAKRMTQEGIHVLFGIKGLKVHSKLILIKRKEEGVVRRYTHVGTGNFNEKTAQQYTDISLLTSNQEIGEDVEKVFEFLEAPYRHFHFKHVWVSPVNTRHKFGKMLLTEVKNAKHGQRAEVFLKVNNLVDDAIIEQLYEASQHGVKIRVIVRGMCALQAGIKGLSENIEVISIVDRFLEHSRVFCFYNGGDERIFISSADIMTRNIEERVELTCPIFGLELKEQIKSILEIHWRDNTKARVIDASQSNHYKKRGNKKKVRSQLAIYDYLKARNMKANEPGSTEP
ncbi:polyphosphate kinase [Pseudidiomarina planktonica]|uniref:Polyphosphate kinase n=1 Tax=Pseudidiomarina planktonica TaxID=1323738 RepID=A0A1Y6E8J9_9GAMM|nr:polyphosphate kinase 1 [Pseudidiomarina planktonica]RUO66319.1 polyphosphate kinase 1 [Pseudidiomarina planktonica]SMQ58869.1 polyphosphate kinase [Pseudidiomarina planktonica]